MPISPRCDTDSAGSTSDKTLFTSFYSAPTDWVLNPPDKTSRKDLSGGGSITPKFEADFAADEGKDGSPISYNETGTFVLSLASGKTFSDIIAALEAGTLRVGLHIRSIDTDDSDDAGSDAFVNITPVPEPGTLALQGLGILGPGLQRRRSRKTNAA